MDILAAVLMAIGLAACAGLRAFLPIFGVGLAARLLGWPLPSGLDTLASDTALLIFGIATLVELAADKIAVVDNILDAIHTVIGPSWESWLLTSHSRIFHCRTPLRWPS